MVKKRGAIQPLKNVTSSQTLRMLSHVPGAPKPKIYSLHTCEGYSHLKYQIFLMEVMISDPVSGSLIVFLAANLQKNSFHLYMLASPSGKGKVHQSFLPESCLRI